MKPYFAFAIFPAAALIHAELAEACKGVGHCPVDYKMDIAKVGTTATFSASTSVTFLTVR